MAENGKPTDGAVVDVSTNQQGAEQKPQSKVLTLTEEELNQKLQSESDKRVSEALKTSKAKWEQDYEQRVKKERDEAERLARMNEEDRKKEEDKKREEQLSLREHALHRKEMENEAMRILSQKDLPVTFAPQLLGETAEDTQSRISEFQKAWNSELDKRVAEKLKGKIPPADSTQARKSDINEHIRNMARR